MIINVDIKLSPKKKRKRRHMIVGRDIDTQRNNRAYFYHTCMDIFIRSGRMRSCEFIY